MNSKNDNRNCVLNKTGRGFTLVELLVVIAIMASLTALMLPRLRVVNKDRNIREAARVIGSKFAEASDRARRDGKASLTIVRNPNFLDADDVEYAGTQMYLSRAVPNYVGDSGGTGFLLNSTVLRIEKPLEYDVSTPQQNVVRVGDQVRLSKAKPVTSTVRYEIVGITPRSLSGADFLLLELNAKSTQPAIPYSGGVGDPPERVNFVIERQPKILRSSITDLPPGYIIDLRLSGTEANLEPSQTGVKSAVTNLPPRRPVFYERLKTVVRDAPVTNVELSVLREQHRRIEIQFDSQGAISHVHRYYADWDNPDSAGTPGFRVTDRLSGSLNLFVSPSQAGEGESPIFSSSNLWVTVNAKTGGVSINYNNPPIAATDTDLSGNIDLHELIPVARESANSGVSASQ